ncbi:MAG: hypothetical protein F8N37_11805 [Telmatospirillum sp.]|nr:hypothetical protein [Telmatospirillum sp.]
MSSLNERPLSPRALTAAGLLVLGALAGVGFHQWSSRGDRLATAPGHIDAPAAVLASRTLRFVDIGDGPGAFAGHVRVFDERTGRELPELAANEGFVRTVLNALSFERTRRSLVAPPVFDLSLFSDNKLVMTDRATGSRVILGQFGARNRDVFLRFLERPEVSR